MPRTLAEPGLKPPPRAPNLKAIGVVIRHRRLTLGMRIDDAAHGCGVASSVLSRIENGHSIGVDRLLRVLFGLGLSMLVTSKDEATMYDPDKFIDE